MKRCKFFLVFIVLTSCFCCGLFSLPAQATNLNTELIIQPKQCLLDTTATGLQPTVSLNPEDCIQGLPGLLASPEQPPTKANSTDMKMLPDTTSGAKSSAIVTPSPNPNALRDKVIAVLVVAVGVAAVTVVSADTMVLNRRLTRVIWRLLRRVISFVQNSGN